MPIWKQGQHRAMLALCPKMTSLLRHGSLECVAGMSQHLRDGVGRTAQDHSDFSELIALPVVQFNDKLLTLGEPPQSIRSLGIPSNLNWVPADENAWTYAAANDDWNFDSSTDPVK